MLAESLISFARNQDEYGRPIFDRDRYTQGQNIANTMATLFSPFEPGVIKSARDVYKNRKIVCVFQPHRYSRLKLLKKEYKL